MRYSIELREWVIAKGYRFLSFAKNIKSNQKSKS